MISLTPPFSRVNQLVFVLGIVCLATILAGTIFVAACSEEGELSVVSPATTVTALVTDASTKARIAEPFGGFLLRFEINNDQTDQEVKFLSHGSGYALFLTATEAALSRQKPQPRIINKYIKTGFARCDIRSTGTRRFSTATKDDWRQRRSTCGRPGRTAGKVNYSGPEGQFITRLEPCPYSRFYLMEVT